VMINWEAHQQKNWRFHHNTVHGISNGWPPALIRAEAGVAGLEIANNTIEVDRGVALALFSSIGGASSGIELLNNIVSRTAPRTGSYPGMGGNDAVVHLGGSATLADIAIENNLFEGFPATRIVKNDATYTPASVVTSGNIEGQDPAWLQIGSRETTYYDLGASSPAREAGIDIGYPFTGSKPNIGSH
jgi:hypothetical protein